MRIAASLRQYPPNSLVGSWITTHEFLRDLVQRGHDVTVFARRWHGNDYELDGVQVCSGRRGQTAINAELEHADVVVCHGPDRELHDVARPVVRLIHSAYDLAPFDQDAIVVFNSISLAESIRPSGTPLPARAMVLRPPVDPHRYRTTPGSSVTIIGCSEKKGIRTAWRCADQLPHLSFLAVRGGYGEQVKPRASNLEVIDRQLDMRTVYGRTRILLMPSSVETWGRTGVESMASGIPVIAHPTPGLVESLDSAGIFVDRDDTAGWVAEIERLHDVAEWAAASRRSLERSAELEPSADLDAFASAIESLQRESETT